MRIDGWLRTFNKSNIKFVKLSRNGKQSSIKLTTQMLFSWTLDWKSCPMKTASISSNWIQFCDVRSWNWASKASSQTINELTKFEIKLEFAKSLITFQGSWKRSRAATSLKHDPWIFVKLLTTWRKSECLRYYQIASRRGRSCSANRDKLVQNEAFWTNPESQQSLNHFIWQGLIFLRRS